MKADFDSRPDEAKLRWTQGFSKDQTQALSPNLQRVVDKYPVLVPGAWQDRLGEPGSPLWRQVIPDERELEPGDELDPLAEERHSVLPGAIRRYSDRLLVLVSDRCAGYCRFCTRKRLTGHPEGGKGMVASREPVLAWLRDQLEIRDVLLSGGDPLCLSDDELEAWIRGIREVRPDMIIRLGTRMPSFAPERISRALIERLKVYRPLYLNLHFNHPEELGEASRRLCRDLSLAGLILANQTVLLAGVNDSVEILRELFWQLLGLGVKPYYLHLMDHVAGTRHFRVSLKRAAAIWQELARASSGMIIPRMMIDLPGGGGKIQFYPELEIRELGGGRLAFKNTLGGWSEYQDIEE